MQIAGRLQTKTNMCFADHLGTVKYQPYLSPHLLLARWARCVVMGFLLHKTAKVAAGVTEGVLNSDF